MHNRFITVLLFLFLSVQSFGQEQYQLILEKGIYQTEASALTLEISIQNNSKETLVMVKPRSEHFKEHYRFKGLHFIGELQKPYILELSIEKPCDTEIEMMAPVQDYPISAHLMKYDFISVSPGERSESFKVYINLADIEFCEEGQYTARILYNPQYETITKKQRKFLEEKKKAFDDLIEESASYIEQQQLSPDTIRTSGTVMHYVLDSHYFIKSLTDTQLISEKIELTKN